jgi:hypothetical protein
LKRKIDEVADWNHGHRLLKEAAGTCMAEPRLWITFLSTSFNHSGNYTPETSGTAIPVRRRHSQPCS